MALIALTDAKVLFGPADLSGRTNSVELSAEVEDQDVTVFGNNGWKSVIGGLRDVTIENEGFWDAGNYGLPDDRLFTDLGVTAVPATVTPTPNVGDVSYFTRVMRPDYSFGDQVGNVLPFSTSAKGDGTSLVRGAIVDNQARTATGTTTVVQLTAPTATTRVYAAVHVLAVAGTNPALSVTLQGDNAAGFPSPATVASASGINTVGGLWLAGPVGATVDNFYRLSYTVSGTSPSFLIFASIGLAP